MSFLVSSLVCESFTGSLLVLKSSVRPKKINSCDVVMVFSAGDKLIKDSAQRNIKRELERREKKALKDDRSKP